MSKKLLVIVAGISLLFLSTLFIIGVFSFFKTKSVSEGELKNSYLALADFNYAQGDFYSAVGNYEQVLKLDDKNIGALLGFGKAILKEGLIVPRYFQKVLEKDPQNKSANYYMGLISLDSPKIAKKYLELSGEYELEKKNKILELLGAWPEEISSYLHKRLLIAQIDIVIGENNLAINLLKSVVSERADYRDAWILLGQAYYNTAKYEDALGCFKKALELDGDNEEVKGLVEKARKNVK